MDLPPSATSTTPSDSAPTSTPAPQVTEGALVCNPTRWKCTDGDIQESYIDKTIALWKKDINKKLQVLSPDPKHGRAFMSYTDGYSNAMYVFNANWTEGCTAEPSHDVYGGDFDNILKSLWKDCTGNGGAGGTWTEGCASYGFEPYCEGYF
ncbi:uncharacterized protein BDZ99DRAFT_467937 [Mytilinidion resinicola]|uniref:Uncharacterized protein n=1 Tax=Mytilinidion resinicola TaxID=574789 RepID=A0A6A6Y4V7_9PEZI|nr:uncharacterized protein BDZ99DRAFT_467937 [Mytilinidion resinicola]KAF2803822.1 hypothetical protein BDZ99DRAFT_467937 [Mytilinidion resinicola]